MFSIKFDEDGQSQSEEEAPDSPLSNSATASPASRVPTDMADNVDFDLEAELMVAMETGLRKDEKKRKRKNKKQLSSKRMRKLANKHVRESTAQKGIGTKRSNEESLHAFVQSIIDNNKDVDADQLRADIIKHHKESSEICERLQKVIAELLPAEASVRRYREVLKRASKTTIAGSRLLINLSSALRSCLYDCDQLLKNESTRAENYVSVLARTEALARSSARPAFGSGFGRAATAAADTGSRSVGQSAVVLFNNSSSQALVATDGDQEQPFSNPADPVQFAVPLGNGSGLVELRATSAAQVMTGQLNESFLECSLARQNHRAVLTEEGALAVRPSRPRISNVRAALEQCSSIKSLRSAAAQRDALTSGAGTRPQIEASAK